jgi:hypothetical protein
MNYDSEFLFYCANVHQYPNTYLLCRIADIDQKNVCNINISLEIVPIHTYLKMNLSTKLFVSLFIHKSIFKVLS